VTVVCTVCLLAQVGNLIHSSFSTERNIYAVNVALWIIELAPCALFVFMFKVHSDFTKRLKRVASRMESLKSRASRVVNKDSIDTHETSTMSRND